MQCLFARPSPQGVGFRLCALAGALCAIGGELLGDPCLNVALAVEHPTADRFRGFSSKTSRSMSLVWRRMICVPGFHPHELRHTAASLAIASGADVKIVQQMLGHKSATMTLDLYGTCSTIGSTLSPTQWTPIG